MSEQTIPTDISFTDDDVARGAARNLLNEGWYRFKITDSKQQISKNNYLMLVNQCAPLKDPDDGDSQTTPTVIDRVVLPWTNPNVDGHVPPKTGGLVVNFVRSVVGQDEHPYFPRRNPQSGSMEFKGETFDETEVDAKRKELTKLAYGQLLEWWKDPSQLIDYVFYGLIQHNGDFAQISRIKEELPDNAELVPEGSFTETPSVSASAKSKSNGKTGRIGRAKASGKAKAAKRASRRR